MNPDRVISMYMKGVRSNKGADQIRKGLIRDNWKHTKLTKWKTCMMRRLPTLTVDLHVFPSEIQKIKRRFNDSWKIPPKKMSPDNTI